MNQRILLNLVLLAVVGALVILTIYEPGIESKAPAPTLTHLPAAEIQHIHLQRERLPDVLLEKRQQHWLVKHNSRWLEANQWRATQLSKLASATSLNSFAAPASLGQYGLDTPKARIRLNQTAIALGDSDPLQRRRYLLLDGRVHLIADTFYQHLFAVPTDYISTKLLPENSSITGIETDAFSVSSNEQGQWQSSRPAEDESLRRFVDEWRHAQALSVKEQDGGKGRPIKISLADQPAVKFYLQKPLLIRPDLGLAYELSEDTLKNLTRIEPEN